VQELERSGAQAWGLWRVPEATARWLGPVRGRSVLELGCGAARWSIGLRRRGARVIGLDQSGAQLSKARALVATAGVRVPLIRANAERLPFQNGSFDLVFCDWGALTFADPRRCVPECSRVLRRNGRLVFATGTWFGLVGWDARRDRLTRRLLRPYFGPMGRPVGDLVEFRPTFPEWFELFHRNRFAVERVSETRPPAEARSSYVSARDTEWAHSWPVECIWRVRKT
jgi:SAM-dependent methyltransferase